MERKKEKPTLGTKICFLIKKENQQKSFLILFSGPIQQHPGLPLTDQSPDGLVHIGA